ncbi:carboxylesterase family protein [Cordyceps javanica]|uniref:Carboxylesterase family protein n=1 Tax=Cordyceps javanica TaxID=43265 RepID=A0A545UQF3_9HYPO|nr:carboxylesterase family protein [Cordyceps javanica]
MAPVCPESIRNGHTHKTAFDILEDATARMHLYPPADKDINSLSRALGELAIHNNQNISLARTDLDPKLLKTTQIQQHVSRLQRPALSVHTFEPLAALDENSDTTFVQQKVEATISTSIQAPTQTTPEPTLREQVQKHLAAEARSDGPHQPRFHGGSRESTEAMLFGCNLLRCASKPGPSQQSSVQQQQRTNRVTLLATPISDIQTNLGTMSWDQQNAPPPYEGPALKVPEVVDMVENALSPALSGMSDRSESFAGSSRTGSFSVPRIEDSLEELDKLEEQLEAVGALAKIKTAAPSDGVARSPAAKSTGGSPSVQSMTQRASVMNLSNKSSQKSLRRSASMTLRQKNQQPATPPTKKPDSPASGSTRRSVASTPSRSPTAKSTKQPTVPKFELPGEAVARRLKEQREARQALLEKNQKATVAPAKPRTVTKPSFELPGEAISRRKREQHEAKLRAEEEEMRRKREFKARPFRNSSAPGVAPRETIASRARQAKLQEDEAKAKAAAATVRGKRLSVVPTGQVSAAPGTVRKTSAPTPGPRPSSSLSAAQKTARRQSTMGDISVPRLRPQVTQDTGVKSAREQAAERSRAASREWAEKKRRQEMAQKEAQQRSAVAGQVRV